MDIFQWIGFVGMIFIVWAYFILQQGRYAFDSLYYQLLNLIGAILLLISLLVHFNFGSFMIEVFWIGITIYGLIKMNKKRQAKKPKKQ